MMPGPEDFEPHVGEPPANPISPDPYEMTKTLLERLTNSRFRFLVAHLPLNAQNAGTLHVVHGLLEFLNGARGLFRHAVVLNREIRESRDKLGHKHQVPIAKAGQPLFSSFTTTIRPLWRTSEEGRLVRQQDLEGMDPAPALIERFVKLFNDSDPALIRQCAFVECRRVLYARRADQPCCLPGEPGKASRCNNSRLQREHYHRDELEAKSKIAMRASAREARKRSPAAAPQT